MNSDRHGTHNCAIREFTADGVSVGRCCFYVGVEPPYVCPRHGDVTDVQRTFAETGKLTNETQHVRKAQT